MRVVESVCRSTQCAFYHFRPHFSSDCCIGLEQFAGGGGGWVARSFFPADFAKPVSLVHRVVLHGRKLSPIGWGTSSSCNSHDFLYINVKFEMF